MIEPTTCLEIGWGFAGRARIVLKRKEKSYMKPRYKLKTTTGGLQITKNAGAHVT